MYQTNSMKKFLKVTVNGNAYDVVVEEVKEGEVNNTGWKEGRFMLTISEQEIQQAAPAILERRLQQKLGELFK